jgi:hypothetical protein
MRMVSAISSAVTVRRISSTRFSVQWLASM